MVYTSSIYREWRETYHACRCTNRHRNFFVRTPWSDLGKQISASGNISMPRCCLLHSHAHLSTPFPAYLHQIRVRCTWVNVFVRVRTGVRGSHAEIISRMTGEEKSPRAIVRLLLTSKPEN